MRMRKGDNVRIDCRAMVVVSQPRAKVTRGHQTGERIEVELLEDYVIPAGTHFDLRQSDYYKALA